MPISQVIKGDIIALAEERRFSAIVHGCNCIHAMGSGLAPQIAKRWPKAELADFATPYNDESKVGTISHYIDKELDTVIVNAYTQFHTGTREDGRPAVDYTAIKDVFTTLNDKRGLQQAFKPVGIPMIGAGLAGGHWEAIETIIDLVTPDIEITLVEYEQFKPFSKYENDKIEAITKKWNSGDSKLKKAYTLHECLGMTREQHALWLSDPSINERRS